MSYTSVIEEKCRRDINKATKKNTILRKILDKKINEVILNPNHYKPLRHDLKGERRVHIMKSFILKFIIDEKNKSVVFIFFGHHDDAY